MSNRLRETANIGRLVTFAMSSIFALSGLGLTLLSISCYLHHSLRKFAINFSDVINIHFLIIASIFIGILMIMAGLLGVYSAREKSENYLGIYTVAIFFLIVIQGAVVFIFHQEWDAKFHIGISRGMMIYSPDKPVAYIDIIQSHFQCCGSDSPLSYKNANEAFKKGVIVPQSCCNTTVHPKKCLDFDIEDKGVEMQYSWSIGCTTGLRERFYYVAIRLFVTFAIADMLAISLPLFYCCILGRITGDDATMEEGKVALELTDHKNNEVET